MLFRRFCDFPLHIHPKQILICESIATFFRIRLTINIEFPKKKKKNWTWHGQNEMTQNQKFFKCELHFQKTTKFDASTNFLCKQNKKVIEKCNVFHKSEIKEVQPILAVIKLKRE